MSEPPPDDELACIDRAWEMERWRYLMPTRRAASYVPSVFWAVAMGVAAGGLGLLWAVVIVQEGGVLAVMQWPLCLLFVALAAVVSVRQFRAARRYRAAYREYLRRREAAGPSASRERERPED